MKTSTTGIFVHNVNKNEKSKIPESQNKCHKIDEFNDCTERLHTKEVNTEK